MDAKDNKQCLSIKDNNSIKLTLSKPSVIPQTQPSNLCSITAKGDSGASGHYCQLSDSKVLNDIKQETGPTVHLPDMSTIVSEQCGQIPISTELSRIAQKAAILKNLQSASLISFGQLCDDNCEVLLKMEKCFVIKNKNHFGRNKKYS